MTKQLGVRMLNLIISISVVLIISQLPPGTSFNIDTFSARIFSQNASGFGYSVTQHVDDSGPWLVVGAPFARGSQTINHGGSVFRCSPNSRNLTCSEIELDKKTRNPPQQEVVAEQFLGATVASTNGTLIACAPLRILSRYLSKHQIIKEDLVNRSFDAVGKCFMMDRTSLSVKQIAACNKAENLARRCLSGFTAAISSTEPRLFIGAIAKSDYQGAVLSSTTVADFNEDSSVKFKGSEYKYEYMGYSMATGDFNNDNNDDIAVGAPRESLNAGSVHIFSSSGTKLFFLADNTNECSSKACIGEYFGYSVAAADFNGDGLDDIAVGAPFYSRWPFDAYERGRVYIFYQKKASKLPFDYGANLLLYGKSQSGSRFGTSLSALGDINRDGYMDLAVGAPYEDDAGVVYIYLGTSGGLLATPAQVVRAAALPNQRRPVGAFGFSLSGGLDLDGNQHADLLVGAYKTDTAVYFRSRPVIRMTHRVLTSSPGDVSPFNKTCVLKGTLYACFTLRLCLDYEGFSVPRQIDVSLTWSLDVNHNPIRAIFADGHSAAFGSQSLTMSDPICIEKTAYLQTDMRDKQTSIVAMVTYALKEDYESSSSGYDSDLPPILDYIIPKNITTEVKLAKKCGEDDICIPKLNVTAYSLCPDYVPVGVARTTGLLQIVVLVVNNGEDAYDTQVTLHLPPGVGYVNTDPYSGETVAVCVSGNAKHPVVCDVGNPLSAGQTAGFILQLLPTSQVVKDADKLSVSFHASAKNESLSDLHNNNATVTVPIRIFSNIQLLGVSKPPSPMQINITSNFTHTNDSKITHIYELRNKGPSSITRLGVNVSWPTHLYNGQSLVNLTTPPLVTKGNGTCRLIDSGQVTASNSSMEFIGNLSTTLTGSDLTLRCGTTNQLSAQWHLCTTWYCDVIVSADEDAVVEAHGEMQRDTIVYLLSLEVASVIITSSVDTQVTDVPYSVKLAQPIVDHSQVETQVKAVVSPPVLGPPPLWIIIVASIAGCTLLFIVVMLLYKCGFFKRRKVEEEMEHRAALETERRSHTLETIADEDAAEPSQAKTT